MDTCNNCIHVAVCGDCFHAELCEKSEMLVGFSRDNPAYCGMFLNSADVAPVVHGEWEQRPNGEVVCSRCGALVAVGNGDALKEAQESQHFCFNCGAKMDGGAGNGC